MSLTQSRQNFLEYTDVSRSKTLPVRVSQILSPPHVFQ